MTTSVIVMPWKSKRLASFATQIQNQAGRSRVAAIRCSTWERVSSDIQEQKNVCIPNGIHVRENASRTKCLMNWN